MVSINFNDIRDGAVGFEDLCAQLARAETDSGEFVRTGNPDAGVECYQVLATGEHGWQAKYFLTTPNASQWRQIDKSVYAALDGHPNLVRYVVCVPVDLPDGRPPKGKSARDRWNDRVQKWQAKAQARGMNVEFEWWGKSELTARLVQPENAGLVRYRFDKSIFDRDWFNARIDEAIETAGPRYSPELHVSGNSRAAEDLETFARSESVTTDVKALAIELRQARLRPTEYKPLIPDADLGKQFADIDVAIEAVLRKLSELKYDPSSDNPFADIGKALDVAVSIADKIAGALSPPSHNKKEQREPLADAEREYDAAYLRFISFRQRLATISGQLTRVVRLTSNNLLILTGNAGVGKTHLLCDFAARHHKSGAPVILLMGQRFTSTDDPMRQMLTHLGYPTSDFHEFIGALESAAQAANRRALIIIDAINEGQGLTIWEPHLAALRKRVSRSKWIGIALSIRSDYVNEIIPEAIRNQVAITTHRGFEGIEFDAVKSFCEYYDLQLPSMPILQPEFSNPLWLKIVCDGLCNSGEKHLPSGVSGITEPLNQFIESVNTRLAKRDALDFRRGNNLVKRAVDILAERMAADNAMWLDSQDAQDLVDPLLPRSRFSETLYHGMLTEGVLTETQIEAQPEEQTKVHFTYERIGEHLVVRHLLGKYDAEQLPAALQPGGELSRHGYIAALSIQVPELFGKELLDIAPDWDDLPNLVEAFSESLLWRDPSAVTDRTKSIVRHYATWPRSYWQNETMDALLSIALVERHPLNAHYLDSLLREADMPSRDAWWSTHLHNSWGAGGPLDKLIAWALSAAPDDFIAEDALNMATITLAWTLTSSNRFARDKATKGLVNLLRGRPASAEDLINRFADVDDPYVLERIYAVAYGVAMLSRDRDGVGGLASNVYRRVFANGEPPAHILLRDYARGVVERAVHLGADLGVDLTLARPPYQSEWPDIPTEDAIASLATKMAPAQTSNDADNRAWEALRFSVEYGDFANYVIGANSGYDSSDWLTRALDEEPWLSFQERKETFLSSLSQAELAAIKSYEATLQDALIDIVFTEVDDNSDLSQSADPFSAVEENEVMKARDAVHATLSAQHLAEWKALDESPARLDLRIMQRYILNRVVSLGWTAEAFGEFDAVQSMTYTRSAHKSERLGKKYQWIAYHEIMACIADHYQFCPRREGTQRYEGAWQLPGIRDIDPSVTIPRGNRNAASPDEPASTQWALLEYDNWRPQLPTECWITDHRDIPELSEGLVFIDSENPNARWLNVYCFQSRRQPHPPDEGKYDGVRRDIWTRAIACLIPQGKEAAFSEWVLSGAYRQDNYHFPVREVRRVFVGEHGWGPAPEQEEVGYREYTEQWSYPPGSDPVAAYPIATTVSTAISDYDCSMERGETGTLYLPTHAIIRDCRLTWTGTGARYVDPNDNLAAYSPSEFATDASALLIRADILEEYAASRNLVLCWAVIGEKRTIGAFGQPYGWLDMHGAYTLRDGKPIGEQAWAHNPPSPEPPLGQ